MLKEVFLVVVAVVVLAEATLVNRCSTGPTIGSLNQVLISNCDRAPCKLKKRTTVAIEEKFTPSRDVDSLMTSVHATILGLPLPFIGVDGGNACDNIYTLENKKVGCPLKAGTMYIYKNEFPIQSFYPTVTLVVYWALVENGTPVTCFEIPSKIVT